MNAASPTAPERGAADRMDRIYRPEFLAIDVARQIRAKILGASGFRPQEHSYQISAKGPRWRLRDYGGGVRGSLLVVSAPIKRPYIWDLAPSFSALGYCLDQCFRVHLLEWTPPQLGDEATGLDDCVEAIGGAVDVVTAAANGRAPILLGHSLGGTLAAIFAAFASASVAGLVLLGAPVCFSAGAGPFRDAVVRLVGPAPEADELVPGSFLSQMSALASPATFIWSRLADATMSLAKAQAFETHLRVEHWALDEVPLPGKLMRQVRDWLYRDDRLCRGALPIRGRTVGPEDLATPTLAVVDAADDVAPRSAMEPFLQASSAPSDVLEYPGEAGVPLQHLAVLIGPEARRTLWPEIIAWADRTEALAASKRSQG